MSVITPSDGEPRIEGTDLTLTEIDSLINDEHSSESVADALDITVGEVREALNYITNRRERIKKRGEPLEGVLSDSGVSTEDIVESIRGHSDAGLGGLDEKDRVQ